MLRRTSSAQRRRTSLTVERLELRDTPTVSLLKDINAPALFDSSPGEMAGKYFAATTADHGRELWQTDGTAAGTRIVADLNPGAGSSNPTNLFASIGEVLFAADIGDGAGIELYGVSGNTVAKVKDINPGSGSSSPRDFANVGTRAYFAAYTDADGYELWKTDGTAAGTELVKAIDNTAVNTGPRELVAYDGKVFFVVADTVAGAELWKSDGTAAGTVRVKDIRPGATSSSISGLTVVNDKLFFRADDGVNGSELWVSDGTSAGTTMLKDILPAGSSLPDDLVAVGSTLFFSATTASGRELWKSDGTGAGTVQVKDIFPGASGSNPQDLLDVGGTLYFLANDGVAGRELWKSDGAAAGTVLVKNLDNSSGDSDIESLTNVAGALYFTVFGTQLYKSDGTSIGTVSVKSFSGGSVAPIGVVNGTLYLNAESSASVGNELWMETSVRRANRTVVGAGEGHSPEVKALDHDTGAVAFSVFAYVPTFLGGVRVAVGDVTGDGVDDIVTAPGAGGGPHVRVFDGVTGTVLKEWMAYDPAFLGGLSIAVGDFNADGYADVLCGAGPGGGPHVRVFDGKNLSLLQNFMAFVPNFLGGVYVGAADVNADGRADLAFAAGPGGGPHVRVLSGKDMTELRSFFAYDPAFTGGVTIAGGDLNADGYQDLIVGTATQLGWVRNFDGKTLTILSDYKAFDGAVGVRVASADRNHDGVSDVFVAPGPGAKAVVYTRVGFQSNTFVGGFFDPFGEWFGGIYVGA